MSEISKGAWIGWTATILAALIGLGGMWFFTHQSRRSSTSYSGVVRRQDGTPISGAAISLAVDQAIPERSYSDTDGVFHLEVPADSRVLHLSVRADGYVNYDRVVSPTRPDLEIVTLSEQPKVARPVPVRTPGETESSFNPPKDTHGEDATINSANQVGESSKLVDGPSQSKPPTNEFSPPKSESESRLNAALQCVGLNPLKPEDIRVQRLSDGYLATFSFRNPTGGPMAVLSKYPFAELTTDSGDVMDQRDGLPTEGKFTFWHGEIKPEVWDATFSQALPIPPNSSASFAVHFLKPGNLTGKSAQVTFKLTYLFRDANGIRALSHPDVRCPDVPILIPSSLR